MTLQQIYIYICCRIKNWSKILGVYKLKIGPSYELKTGPSFYFTVFPKVYRVFGVCLSTLVSICAKIVFSQNRRDVQMRFSKDECIFILPFYVAL